jgi:hypothetical protein
MMDEEATWRERTFMEFHGDWGRGGAWRAVVGMVDGRPYKYIYTPGDVEELYDLTQDPTEEKSLAGDPGRRDIRDELAQSLSLWMKETRDDFNGGPT